LNSLEFQWIGKDEDLNDFIPVRKTPLSSGVDLKAYIKKPIVLRRGQSQLIPTGWKVKIPEGYELQVRSRSGLAVKHGVFVLNSPGTIDADYQGELGVILHNTSEEQFVVVARMTIAQLVMCPVALPEIKVLQTGSLFTEDTVRGTGGFGSTGSF
jgi:dUTP pyrophosphatase